MTNPCHTGKIGYATRAEADSAKRNLHAKPRYLRGDPLNVFCCTDCGEFHLGRSKRAGRRDHISTDTGAALNRYRKLTMGQP